MLAAVHLWSTTAMLLNATRISSRDSKKIPKEIAGKEKPHLTPPPPKKNNLFNI